MRTSILMLVVALGLGLAAATTAAGATALTSPGTIRITDPRSSTSTSTAPGRGTRATWTSTASGSSTSGSRRTPLGHSDITCINTGTGSMNCSGTYFLPKGKIMVGGVIASRLFYELAVSAAPGIYDNVRGTLTATYLGGSPGEASSSSSTRDLSRSGRADDPDLRRRAEPARADAHLARPGADYSLRGGRGQGRGDRAQIERLLPDLVLLDVMMPGAAGSPCSSGSARIPRIAETPVVIVSAFASAGDRVKARDAGASGSSKKPFEPEELAVARRGAARGA